MSLDPEVVIFRENADEPNAIFVRPPQEAIDVPADDEICQNGACANRFTCATISFQAVDERLVPDVALGSDQRAAAAKAVKASVQSIPMPAAIQNFSPFFRVFPIVPGKESVFKNIENS